MTAVTVPHPAAPAPAPSPGPAPEQVIARLRPHERALVGPSVLLVLDVAAAVWVLGRLDPSSGAAWAGAAWFGADRLRIAVVVLAAVVALVGFALPVLRFLTRTLTVTTRRVVVRSGVLVHTRQELLHASAYRVTLRRGALQALFGSGDLLLEAWGDHRILVRDVPKARLVQEALADLVDDALRDRRSLPVAERD